MAQDVGATNSGDWAQEVKLELQKKLPPKVIAERMKKLVLSRNDIVSHSAVKTVLEMGGVAKQLPKPLPAIILTLNPLAMRASVIEHSATQLIDTESVD